MSKAYGRVEWPMLRALLLKLGFHENWVKLIMICVESVEYSLLAEGEELGPIKPSRGIRQGDPLSPYLFILIAEGLTALINKHEASGDFHGVGIARGVPKITHLLFANDSFIFFRANLSESTICKHILDLYATASCQLINFEKSSINFSRNVGEEARNAVSSVLGVRRVGNLGTYLGLPSLIGRNRSEISSFLKSRIVGRVHSWNHKFLSRVGREVLLKSVVQALPSYAMNVFLIPAGLTRDIEREMNGFWWGAKRGRSMGIRWKAWNHLCVPKNWGGLGFRSMREFNLALLSKQAWRILQNPSSLVTRILKAKYFPNCGFLEAKKGSNPSFIWSSILETQNILKRSCRWRVGDGNTLKIWEDSWLPDTENPKIVTPPFLYLETARVSAIMNDQVQSGMKMW